MTISISSNLTSLLAQRSLQNTSTALSKSMQRLSTGLRINSAGDDPAGLAIATRMSTQIRSLNIAKQNANEGKSLTDVAYAALDETTNAIQSIRELALEAKSDSKSSGDRTSLQMNINQLLSEIQRIATETKYNNYALLNGSFANRSFQIGANAGEVIKITIGTASLAGIGMGTNGNMIIVSAATASLAQSGASGTILRADSALDSISTIRAELGGAQSRFESILNTLAATSDGYTTARSSIMDTDIAVETSRLARMAIIQQAGVSILAQANLQPQLLLKLLG
ncbi:MAG: flagellin FliC [Magnetococcus sp. YQC-5]